MTQQLVVERAKQVAEVLAPGHRLSDATIGEVRPTANGCLLLFNQSKSPWLYGVALDLLHIEHEYYYGERFPVASWDEWLELLPVNLMVNFDTGLVPSSARIPRSSFIELDETVRWPSLAGYDVSVDVGDDPEVDFVLRGQGAGDHTYSDCDATILRTASPDIAEVRVESSAGVESREALECLHTACHIAELAGYRSITMSRQSANAALIGFAPDSERGGVSVETNFLAESFPSPHIG